MMSSLILSLLLSLQENRFAMTPVLLDYYDGENRAKELKATFKDCTFDDNKHYGPPAQPSLVVGNSRQSRLVIERTRFSNNDMIKNNTMVRAKELCQSSNPCIQYSLPSLFNCLFTQSSRSSFLVESNGPLTMVSNCFENNLVGVSPVVVYHPEHIFLQNHESFSAGTTCSFVSTFETPEQFEAYIPRCFPFDLIGSNAVCPLDGTPRPTGTPTSAPTAPTMQPSSRPSHASEPPSMVPSLSLAPTIQTDAPTEGPTFPPTDAPSFHPTKRPTGIPSTSPSISLKPTTMDYTPSPTGTPTLVPTSGPTTVPTLAPVVSSVAKTPANAPNYPPVADPPVTRTTPPPVGIRLTNRPTPDFLDEDDDESRSFTSGGSTLVGSSIAGGACLVGLMLFY